MLVGHYGAGLAIKRVRPDLPLWALFIAVQLVDVFWALFVLGGIERVRIVPGITATNPFDLYYMPYTHSLVATVAWALLAAGAWRLATRGRAPGRALAWLGIAVVSHWVFDFIVHRPDLPLYDDTAKVGLGLWNLPLTALALEFGLVLAGLALYLGDTMSRDRASLLAVATLLVLTVVVQLGVFFGRPPETPAQAAIAAPVIYALFALAAWWLERTRQASKRRESDV